MVNRMRLLAPVAAAVLGLGLAACSSSGETTTDSSAAAGISEKADAALAEIQGQVLAKGPHGEEPSPASVADLTADEVAQVKDMGATAAIVMHYGGNDWANAQIAGLKARVRRTRNRRRRSDRRQLRRRPAGLRHRDGDDQEARHHRVDPDRPGRHRLGLPEPPPTPEPSSCSWTTCPDGLTAGKDYVSVVSADNYGNGVVSAHLMAKALGGTGQDRR